MAQVRGDVEIDVSSSPYETGFKFNTLPFGGMTIDANDSVRIGSATDIKLVPPAGNTVILGTTGSAPTASAAHRGALFIVQGAGGVADVAQVCLKSAADTYSWKTIVTG
jgi:hypothetical protein